ncbi:MAG: VIT domain-containing protein [Acidobacteriota bacterium]
MKAPCWLLVCALSAHVAIASAATTEGRLVAKHDGKPIDIPLEHTDVHLRVDAFLVDATVTQRFANPYADKIEAVYLFPLPTGAAVTELTIRSGGRTIRGTIQERQKAQRIYAEARAKGFVAALLTEERPNLFTQSIANLEPGATVEVTLRYVERLAYDDGGYEVVFPMVAGPRYAAGSNLVQAPALPAGTRSAHDIALAVDLDAGVPVEELTSPSHQLVIERPAPARARVHLAPGDTIPNKDFVLRYKVAGRAPQLGVLAYKDGGEGSFLLVAQPPASAPDVAIAPREIVFVLDTSSSMRGAPLAKARDVIRGVLGRLRPDDTFQIVRFDDQASALGPRPIANKPRNVQLTLDWLAKLEAGGGTELATGLAAALAVPHDPARLRIVAFLTDGYIGNEDEILASVGAHLGDSRVFCFGVGSAVNRYLLEEMAGIGRGTAQFVRPDEDTAAAVGAFERRIDAPVLTDLAIDWHGLAVTDVVPHALPDLFLGQPLAITGHYAHAGAATITVRGKQGGRDVAFDVGVELPERDAARPAIATVWARQRIAELERRLERKADPALEHEILALALEHHLLTRYTAFVAVDDSRTTAPGDARRVVVPVDVPDAVRGISAAVQGGSYGYGAVGYGVGGGGSGWGTIGYGSYGTIGHGSGAGVGYAVTSHVAAVPVVVIAQPMVVGDLDKSIIRRYVKRRIEKIRYCYEKRLGAKPTLAGTVTAHFTVSDAGKVVASFADGLDAEVASCVADVIRDIEFPSTNGGGAAQINYPFTFHPNVVTEENRP